MENLTHPAILEAERIGLPEAEEPKRSESNSTLNRKGKSDVQFATNGNWA